MTQIDKGSNSTLKSTSAEGQLAEVILLIQQLETNLTANPSSRDAVSAAADFNTLTFTGNFSIPCSQEISNTGQVVLVPTSYLLQTNFAGGGGTIKSNSIEGYLLELFSFLQIREQVAAKNPNQENRVTGSYDSDEQLYSGSVSLSFALAIDSNGMPVIDVNEYLLD